MSPVCQASLRACIACMHMQGGSAPPGRKCAPRAELRPQGGTPPPRGGSAPPFEAVSRPFSPFFGKGKDPNSDFRALRGSERGRCAASVKGQLILYKKGADSGRRPEGAARSAALRRWVPRSGAQRRHRRRRGGRLIKCVFLLSILRL